MMNDRDSNKISYVRSRIMFKHSPCFRHALFPFSLPVQPPSCPQHRPDLRILDPSQTQCSRLHEASLFETFAMDMANCTCPAAFVTRLQLSSSLVTQLPYCSNFPKFDSRSTSNAAAACLLVLRMLRSTSPCCPPPPCELSKSDCRRGLSITGKDDPQLEVKGGLHCILRGHSIR